MKYYWRTKDGTDMDVDNMTPEHLRNVLKLIIRRRGEKKSSTDTMLEEVKRKAEMANLPDEEYEDYFETTGIDLY